MNNKLTKHEEKFYLGRVELMVKSGHTDEDIFWLMSKHPRKKIQEWIDICRGYKSSEESKIS